MPETVPLIIEAAINGATSKHRNPNVPRTPAEVTADALRCIEAGAAIVHNHNDDPVLGGATGRHATRPYVDAWRPILARYPGVLLYPTMAGGGPHTTITERYAHIEELCAAGLLRVGLVDCGSCNIGPLDRDGLPAAVDLVYQNTYADARSMFETCERLRLGPSISCFEGGFVRVAAAYARAGRMPPGALVKFYFGGDHAAFGLPPTEASLNAYLGVIEGTGLPWQAACQAGDVIGSGMARLAIERGGHVRVGLEDYAGPGTPRNEELVRAVAAIAAEVGRPIATPEEAAAILGIPRGAAGG